MANQTELLATLGNVVTGNPRGATVVGFYNELDTWPVVFNPPVAGLGIMNKSGNELNLTVTTIRGPLVTKIAGGTAYDDIFEDILEIDCNGLEFDMVVRK
jgi:hypothetical protein